MTNPTRAFVHRLASPARLAEATPIIRAALFGVLGVADPERYQVDVSPTSGRISFVDREELWGAGLPPSLPATQAEARATAERFLRALGQAFATIAPKLREDLRGALLLPPAEPRRVAAIPRPNGHSWDHWLYQAQPTLPLGDRSRAPVAGTAIEVRIGRGGHVIAYTSSWPPVLVGHLITAVRPPPAVAGVDGQPPPDPATFPIVYHWDGDGIPQYYLAPFYVVPMGNDPVLASASPYSLTADFAWGIAEGGGTEVIVIATGGSGQYDYGFASYRPDDPWDDGLTIRDGRMRRVMTEDGGAVNAGVVTIPPGAHVVMTNIRDRCTGAFRHAEQFVIGALSSPQPPSVA